LDRRGGNIRGRKERFDLQNDIVLGSPRQDDGESIAGEPEFPLYCQGAVFGLSRKLVRTAVEGGHVESFRYIPFEDVSIGILAERCGRDKFHATMIPGIRVFRADTVKERECVHRAIPMTECYKGDDSWSPDARMSHHLIQHRVENREDMVNMHKSLGLDVYWVPTLKQER